MADIIRVDSGDGIFDILGQLPDKSLRLLREAIEEIADHIEEIAIENAPEDTGLLKSQAVDRRDLKRRVRGPGGLVVKTELAVPKKPKYARWVHDGTGLYGPRKRLIEPRTAPFMVFRIEGKLFRKKTVMGQKPQPYLREAVEEAERTIIPIKLAELRAKLELLT